MLLRRLLSEQQISSQEELVETLSKRGHRVTQTTVSRDLAALGAEKVKAEDGEEHYMVPVQPETQKAADRYLATLMEQFVIEIESSLNMALLKTPPGSAAPIAAALDAAGVEGVIASVAGDDTVLVIGREIGSGAEIAQRVQDIMETL
jgi:transcriptional regulator of arginine metabolism